MSEILRTTFLLILATTFQLSTSYKIEKIKHTENSIFRENKSSGDTLICYVYEYIDVSYAVKNCDNIILDNITVPGGATLKLNLQDGTTLVFRGRTNFEVKEHYGYLVEISGKHLTIVGEEGSFLDGNGAGYWDGMGQWSNVAKPNFVQYKLKNSKVSGVNIHNCPKLCSACKGCENVEFENMVVNVTDGLPENAGLNKSGHNTDGLNLYTSTNIIIRDSTIINQDDCICLTQAANITVFNVHCYGGHGFSITERKGTTENVIFRDSIVENCLYGIHVKTPGLPSNATGLIRNITYSNIQIKDATSVGIYIQEDYEDRPPSTDRTQPQPSNGVPIYELNLVNITATANDFALPLHVVCAVHGCFNWDWSNVKAQGKNAANNICENYKPNGFKNCTFTN